jgi:hypothetical protein
MKKNLLIKKIRKSFSNNVLLKGAYHLCRSKSIRILCEISPKLLLSLRYWAIWGKWPNLRDPITFDEKLIWLNLYWRHPLKTVCADKYKMREYVENEGLGFLLPKIYGIYENVEEIEFEKLPEKFVLKCTHGCKFNVFCWNKEDFDIIAASLNLKKWMSIDYSKLLGELHYKGIKPRIICEEFLNDGTGKLPIDYKIFCFSGKAYCTTVVIDREPNGAGKTALYDLEWKRKFGYLLHYYEVDKDIPKPLCYEEMINYANKLSQLFPFVRIDFYSINGRAKLGEISFTPSACINNDMTFSAEQELGSLITLPKKPIL